jgi:tetraacyldisaccharide 4'-kinase
MSAGHAGLPGAWYRGAWWLWLLRPLEWLFRAVAALRRLLYRRGVLAVYRPPKPVVVVGNITVGGTGKTPIVIALVEALQGAGLRPGVVSRGYGASAGQFPHTLTRQSTAQQCGDEPLLIFRRTGCPCVVSPSRAEAVRTLLADFEIDVVISDDGLQHYALARDMEIAVLDAGAALGNGFCLPAGPLREPPGRLQSVDHLLYRNGDDPATGVTYQAEGLVNLRTGERLPLNPAALAPRVHAVAGIGQPGQFFDTLRGAGFEVAPHAFPDHHAYTAADFLPLAEAPVIMTEKDAVKCEGIAGDDAWYLRISARLPAALPEAVAALARH